MYKELYKQVLKGNPAFNVLHEGGGVVKGVHVWSTVGPALESNPDLLFVKCLVLPGSDEKLLNVRQIEPLDSTNKEYTVAVDRVMSTNPILDPMHLSDVGMMGHTNVGCVNDFIRTRYLKGQIYSTADPLLVALNPYKDLGNTTPQVIIQYRDAPDHLKLPPHVFAVARTALENLHAVRKSQTVIVSGESGAGKTEAVKQIMRYFATAKGGRVDLKIQNAVLAGNPILEAFGNAKTVMNNNSSRFGRWMQLQVGPEGGINGGSIMDFLLEKSRIVQQGAGERAYHIFYQVINGAPEEFRKKYALKPIKQYKFLENSCETADGIDDKKDFKEVDTALDFIGLSKEEKHFVYSILSGLLLLGNVQIEGVAEQGIQDAAKISMLSLGDFYKACELMFLDSPSVVEGLTVKIIRSGNQEVRTRWSAVESRVLLESLSKAVYANLFKYLVSRLNMMIEPEYGFDKFMGMLDIFGFEVFQNNSLEQLFINITNEMLQKNFVDVVFERETRLYNEEGISSFAFDWTSNEPIINALIGPKKSICSMLEDQCLSPGGSDLKLLSCCYAEMTGSSIIVKPRVGAQERFTVVHTIAEISYDVRGFLQKNKDVLRAELVEVVNQSKNSVTGALFKDVHVEKGKLAKGQLIGSQFLKQLDTLVTLINSTEPHFIRCLKPNEEKKALTYNTAKTVQQLFSLSILEALQLRNLTFAYRRPFEEFIYQFRFVDLGVAENKKTSARERAEALARVSGMTADSWKMGKTMLFMTNDASKKLSLIQRKALSSWQPLVMMIEAMYARKQLQLAVVEIQPGLVRFQAQCRKMLLSRV